MSDPITNILNSSDYIFSNTAHVTINDNAIIKFCDDIREKDFEKLRSGYEWDACDWHYTGNTPLTAQYIFVMDALNFCFWPVQGFEYEQLATSLRDVLLNDTNAMNANNLKNIDKIKLQSWFPTHELPNIDERVLKLQELGQVLEEDYNGMACNMAAAANHSAVALVSLILDKLPGFRDVAEYKGQQVHFYKRAQILVSDLWAAYGRLLPSSSSSSSSSSGSSSDSDNHYACFHDIDRLTMFADYRVPQILRHLNILEYDKETTDKIMNKIELPAGGEEELEIRAATIIAVNRIQKALQAKGIDLLVVEVDWLLWNQGENSLDTMDPHHRTLTTFY